MQENRLVVGGTKFSMLLYIDEQTCFVLNIAEITSRSVGPWGHSLTRQLPDFCPVIISRAVSKVLLVRSMLVFLSTHEQQGIRQLSV
jgi:hypothetical protein